jgi:hypothetical protein
MNNPTLAAIRRTLGDITRQVQWADQQLAAIEQAEAADGPVLDALTAATLLVRLDDLSEELSEVLGPLDAAVAGEPDAVA